ncbi:MAG: cob(I)yrinic acid a,c-diamide adenosyltransferase [Myxococcota bacterium]|nr:cob(I)yrinic acid a,c-diamide adenosyltransferase [Myxococcota bacterium]
MPSNIYTRSGDSGTTSLSDGTRIPKDGPRVMAYGEIDEANSWIGVARSFVSDGVLDSILELLQHRFYNCSSQLATPPTSGVTPTSVSQPDVDFLELSIDMLDEKTGKLTGFIVPGGTRAAGFLHVARTVCRRAERRIWALARTEEVDALLVKFINRSSDLLFCTARYANFIEASGDVLWDKDLPIPSIEID